MDGWEAGGQVFVDFLKLVRAPPKKRHNADQEAALKRLRRGLAAMQGDGMKKKPLEERVAIMEMSKVLDEQDDGAKDHEMAGVNTAAGGEACGDEMLLRYRQAMAPSA